MDFFAKLKKFAYVRVFFIFAIIGLFFCAGGVFGLVSQSNQTDWVKTTAVIERIETDGEDNYKTFVTYTDSDGVSHTVNANSYSSGMKVGDTIEIKYNPNDKETVATASFDWLPFVALAVGAVAFVGGAIGTVVSLKKSSKEYNDFNKVDENSYTPEQAKEIAESDEESHDYVYHINGKVGYNFLMQTKDKVQIYEMHCDRFLPIGNSSYTFYNHLTQHKQEMAVSNTVSTEVEEGNALLELDYHFKVNGVDCWQHLGNLGYSLVPHLEGMTKVSFEVKKFNVHVATIQMAGTNDIPGAKQYPWGNVPSNVCLKVNCRNSDIEGVAFACFCIAKK